LSDDSVKKTLTLKPRPPAARGARRDEAPSSRSGARARRVAQSEIEESKAKAAAKASARSERPPREGDRPARGPRPEGSARPDRGPRPEGSARPDRRPRDNAREPRPDRGASSAPQYEDPFASSPYSKTSDAGHRADRPRTDRPRDMATRNAAVRASAAAAAQGPAAATTGAEPRADAVQRADPRTPRRPYDKPAGSPMRATVDGHTSGAEIFQVFAPCPLGLDEALANELKELGFGDARPGRAGAHFSTDWNGVLRANLHSRLATRVLAQVAQETVTTEDELYALAKATPWERWFGAEQTLRVDTSAVRSPMQSLQFCNLRAKDGICDRLREREGERPSIDTVRPDARVHVFLSESTATLYLDTSGESLFKRGWRLDKGEAPLRENLAAGMLALAGWDPATPLLDPFCGSGTLVIEAALKALNVPPGISRPFAFERLRGHQERRWYDLKEDARARILKEIPATLAGADIDPRAIDAARMNADRAGLTEEAVYFECADARDTCPLDERAGAIITNPPYGERLDLAENATLWSEWATTLKREFGGWKLHLITSDLDLPKKLRLNPSRRIPLYNGALDCRLFGFDLVSGGFRQP
jgi:putative N6-adenine-specific DNA methylase